MSAWRLCVSGRSAKQSIECHEYIETGGLSKDDRSEAHQDLTHTDRQISSVTLSK